MRRRQAIGSWLTFCLMAIIAGCGGPAPDDTADSPPEQPAAEIQPESRTPPPPPRMVREKAVPGVGEKGQGLGTGPVATPIAAGIRAEEKITFMQITTSMKLYRALNGHFPKSHEEFMKEIIRANGIRLPELPPGQRYVYDAEKAAKMSSYDPNDPPLLVERPQ